MKHTALVHIYGLYTRPPIGPRVCVKTIPCSSEHREITCNSCSGDVATPLSPPNRINPFSDAWSLIQSSQTYRGALHLIANV